MANVQEEDYIDSNSKLGKLIVKLNNIEKKPSLDNSLSEVLEIFLEKIRQSDDYLVNGIFQINFAEAALLLQSSAFVYSKKVDLLWDLINQCQKRMVAFDSQENEEELKRLEEREQKYKRRKKIVETLDKKEKKEKLDNFHVDWQDVYDFQHLNFEKDDELVSDWCEKMIIHENTQQAHKSNMILAEKSCHFRSSNNSIFDKDQDDEFVLHTNKMESVMSLDNLISQNNPKLQDFSFELYKDLYIVPKFLVQKNLIHEDLNKYSEEIAEMISKHRSSEEPEREFVRTTEFRHQQSQQMSRRISITSTVISTLSRSDIERIMSERKCKVNVTRLSISELSRLSRLSIDDMRKMCDSYNEEDSGVHLDDELIESEEEEKEREKEVEIPQEKQKKEVVPSFDKSVDMNGNILIRVDYQKEDENEDCGHVEMSQRTKKRAALTETQDEVQVPIKKRKLSKAEMRKLAKGIITVDLKKFDHFFSMHYQPEEGEGTVQIPEFDPVDSSSLIDPREEPLTQMSESIVCTQDSGYESRIMDENFDVRSPLSLPGQSLSTTPLSHEEEMEEMEIPPPLIQENPVMEIAQLEEKPLHQKVYEWKQFMAEKFKTLKSTDFDIHEYGKNIMENLEENPRKFGEIVKGKSSAEVTRFFISSLQLANTYNVEIQGVQKGKLSNETFSLKLLSKERCYDKLKDYMAPSEEDFEKRLATAENMKKKRVFYRNVETDGGGESSKRKKFV